MKLFDTHAHLDDCQFDADREETIKKIRESGVSRLMDVGTDVETSKLAVDIANAHDFIYAAVGIHPEFAENAAPDDFDLVKRLCETEPKVKAIGEIGIDYYYDECAPREKQIACMQTQLDMAKELDMPVIIHDRCSKGDAIDLVLNNKVERAVFHCFSGSAETAKILVRHGIMISFTGVITFKNARKAIEALKVIPLENLMIETDSPYMTPEPHRGKRNDSSYVRYVAEKMAEVKGLDVDELCQITYQNGLRFFGIDE